MSNLKLKATPKNYAEALEFLGGRVEKKLGHNTDIVKYGRNIQVLYHGNIIATYYEDAGEVKNSTEVPVVALRTAGWNTVTTTGRLHMLLNAVAGGVNASGYRGGVGIKNGAAELRFFGDGPDTPSYAQPIGSAAVRVFTSGHFDLGADVEGARLKMSADEAADRLPY